MKKENKKHLTNPDYYFSDQAEATIESILKAVEHRSVREKAAKSTYYALKAEFKNYLFLKKLFLTHSTSVRARSDEGLSIERPFNLEPDSFQHIIEMQSRIFHQLIYGLVERLNSNDQSRFKSDSSSE